MKERRPLAVGDRVSVYFGAKVFKGPITRIHPYGGLDVCPETGPTNIHAHPKQVRRLVRKSKERVWTEAEIRLALSNAWHLDNWSTLPTFDRLLCKALGIDHE